MLKIRPEQMEAFQPLADVAFEKRVVKYLRENHADAVVQLPTGTTAVKQIADEILREMVQNGIARAHQYGITWQSTLAAFVVLMFESAPNFDEHPLVRRVLRDENIPPNSRIKQLWERTSDQDWEAIKRSYDSSAWHLKIPEDSE